MVVTKPDSLVAGSWNLIFIKITEAWENQLFNRDGYIL